MTEEVLTPEEIQKLADFGAYLEEWAVACLAKFKKGIIAHRGEAPFDPMTEFDDEVFDMVAYRHLALKQKK